MNGIIILPKYLSGHWSPKVTNGKEDFSNISSVTQPIWYAIRDAFGFDLVYADQVDVPPNTDIVVMFGVPYHNRPNMIPGLLDLNKNIKLIMYPGDIQCYDNPVCMANRLKVFDRSDLIISGSHEYFAKQYPQFLFKYRFLPLFFGPDNRYTVLPYNNSPKVRCLLSGSINSKIYPLRTMIKSTAKNVDYRPATFAAGDAYARLLNTYFCCVTSSSIFNYALAKYFEIPAAGSLLIADETNDLIKAGFIPHQHYLPITKVNASLVITECLEQPAKYEHIRKAGMEFVRENHSINKRIETLKILFEETIND
jgi:hypothetical protein